MREQVQGILQTGHHFIFHREALTSTKATRYLKAQTQQVPNEEGLYVVFSTKIINPNEEHLHFDVKGQSMELVYFGKAGGMNAKGLKIKQGLHGRINNVVSDSSRKLKDIARANYWQIVMDELAIPTFYVYYQTMEKAKEQEANLYLYLDTNQLLYPMLNKPLGRSKKK